MNLTLDKDIVDNQHTLNISYDLYYPDSSVSQQMKGISQTVFWIWLKAFNQENKDFIPIDAKRKHSNISLSYRKNGEDYHPKSCQNIHLTHIKTINILFGERDCIIHQ